VSAAAISTSTLGKRYGRHWALRDCTLEIPVGSVTALVGPNGAGKTTLLQVASGLSAPSAGAVRMLGHDPRREANVVLPRLGFVAQEHPLYRGLTVGETLWLGRRMNPIWDDQQALVRIQRLGLSLRQKVGKLSGGQQAQVALTLALAKRPDVLLLDEPIASLDPLARRDFLHTVIDAVADTGMTVMLSSHIITDLERICDYLVILATGGVQLAGTVEETLASHRLLTGPRSDTAAVATTLKIIRESHTGRQSTLLVRAGTHILDARWQQHELDLEEIVLAYLDHAPLSQRIRHEAVAS
jgi:ABC-2 type transport system ATP-binding protein